MDAWNWLQSNAWNVSLSKNLLKYLWSIKWMWETGTEKKNIQFNGNEFPSNYAKENQNCVIEI